MALVLLETPRLERGLLTLNFSSTRLFKRLAKIKGHAVLQSHQKVNTKVSRGHYYHYFLKRQSSYTSNAPIGALVS